MILTHRGMIFKVLTRDYDPAHVHVYKAGATAQIGLGDEESGPYLNGERGHESQGLTSRLGDRGAEPNDVSGCLEEDAWLSGNP